MINKKITFDDFAEAIMNGANAESYISDLATKMCDDFTNVECMNDLLFEDEDLYFFLEVLGAEIVQYEKGFVVIETKIGSEYKILTEDIPNRFGNELSNETVLYFNADCLKRIC